MASLDLTNEELSQLQEVASLFEETNDKPADVWFSNQSEPQQGVSSDSFNLQAQAMANEVLPGIETLISFASSDQVVQRSSPVQLQSLESWSVFAINGSSCGDQPIKPVLHVTKQPPKIYRPRYEKEAAQNPKGYLRDDYRESVAIKLDGVQSSSTGDVVLSIAVVTSSGQAHPTIYPTCFGKSMPRDWVEDDQNRTVMTVLRESEDYKKKLVYLGLKRNTLSSIDQTQVRRHELINFRIKFDVHIPDVVTGELQSVTAETDQIRAVCPGTMTKLRKRRKHASSSVYKL